MVIQEFEKSLRNIALLFDDSSNLDQQIAAFCDSQEVFNFVTEVSSLPLHNHALEKSCAETGKLNLVGAIRRLRGSYPRPLLTFVCLLSETARAFDRNLAQKFEDISLKLQADKLGGESLESLLLSESLASFTLIIQMSSKRKSRTPFIRLHLFERVKVLFTAVLMICVLRQ